MRRLLGSPAFWIALAVALLPVAIAAILFRAWVANVAGPEAATEFSELVFVFAVAAVPLALAGAVLLARLATPETHETPEPDHLAANDELERTQRRLLRAERIAAWRDIAQRIAHEIKNPLQPIRMSIETLQRTRAQNHPDFDAIFDETTDTILEETKRLERIVSEFSRFARLPRPRPAELDLREVVESVVHLLRDDRFTITIAQAETPPVVRADREQITQVVMNLVQNAKDARPAGRGAIVLHFEALVAERAVALTCEDDGPGVPPDVAPHVFEPYFTTKSTGSGLGLAIAHRIAVDHHGALELLPTQRGATFRLVLPLEGPPFDATASTSEALGLIR